VEIRQPRIEGRARWARGSVQVGAPTPRVLNARVAALHRDLSRARPIEFGRIDTTEVRIGARVRLVALDGRERSFAVLGPWDSRPEDGIVSYESELGKRLLGAKPGDEVSVGENKLRVASIEPARLS
jgi:transcription elongation GreA/GreB family factor